MNAVIFAECVDAAGIPAGVFNLVHGDGPNVGVAMSSHPDIDMMSFTGSTRAGISVAEESAKTVKRVTQELGGKSANIILDDAEFEKVIARDMVGMCVNTGQSCNAPTRMLVPEARMDEAAAIAKAAAESINVGDPTSTDTNVGPLVSQMQFDKVQALIQKGIDEGAKLETGGVGRPDGMNRGYFVKPTVFSHVNNEMTIAREEIFGPVLSLIGYKDDADAVGIANDTLYGLSGYVSSTDPERAANVARQIRAGNIHVNGAGVDPGAPFGGYKQSGNGREFSTWVSTSSSRRRRSSATTRPEFVSPSERERWGCPAVVRRGRPRGRPFRFRPRTSDGDERFGFETVQSVLVASADGCCAAGNHLGRLGIQADRTLDRVHAVRCDRAPRRRASGPDTADHVGAGGTSSHHSRVRGLSACGASDRICGRRPCCS